MASSPMCWHRYHAQRRNVAAPRALLQATHAGPRRACLFLDAGTVLAPRRACEAAPEGESTLGVLFEVTVSKILIVEDNEMNRDMLSRRLLRKGYEVIMAEDGESGVVMAQSDRPDVILMDMSLPVIDGWEATRRIKASADLRAIPVIALTAHAMGSDRDKAIEAGCDDYDTKPIELPRLLQKIERLLAGRKQQ